MINRGTPSLGNPHMVIWNQNRMSTRKSGDMLRTNLASRPRTSVDSGMTALQILEEVAMAGSENQGKVQFKF